MTDIINLRRARKQKRRDDKARVAEANRAVYGATKGEKVRRKDEEVRHRRAVDGAKREGSGESGQSGS